MQVDGTHQAAERGDDPVFEFEGGLLGRRGIHAGELRLLTFRMQTISRSEAPGPSGHGLPNPGSMSELRLRKAPSSSMERGPPNPAQNFLY